ncbi:MAG: carbohydrate ABC transporter permease [Enterocloster sp.]
MKKGVSRKGKSFGESAVIFLMVIPSVILLILFVLYPLAWVFRYVFYDYDGLHTAKFVGLANFVRLFTRDPDYWKSVWNTFVYAVGKLIITIPLSFVLAVLLNSKLKLQSVFRAVIFMPTIISTAVMSLVFYFMFNSYNGIVNQMLMRFSVIETPIDWFGRDMAMVTAIIVAAWGAVGNYMIYFLAGLQTVPDEMYEVAKLDGANYFQTMFYVVLPLLGPVLQTVLMLAIITALKGFESIMVLTAGGPAGATDVMYLYVYRTFFPTQGNDVFVPQYGYGSAVAVITAIITGFITILYLKASAKMNQE